MKHTARLPSGPADPRAVVQALIGLRKKNG